MRRGPRNPTPPRKEHAAGTPGSASSGGSMNKKLLAVALSAALALPLVALAQADMSGTWTFDEAKSDPAPQGGGGGGRGGGGGGGGRMGGGTPSKLVIKQAGGTLTVESTLPNGAQ